MIAQSLVPLLLALVGFSYFHEAHGQESAASDHFMVLELGPAFDRSSDDKKTIVGGMAAVEVTAIEDWLELEFGATRLSSAGRRDNSVDLIFKKPFRLSSTAELMVGLGPQVGRRYANGVTGKTRSIEYVLDFMFWPTKKFGWFVEPSYGHGIGPSRGERSLGVSGGLLIGW
jgi:hypothetical protein